MTTKNKNRSSTTGTEMEPVRNLDEANEALMHIAQLRLQLEEIQNKTEQKVNDIREQGTQEAKPIKEEIERYENGLFAYAQMNRRELFAKRRSVETEWGRFGIRKVSKISVSRKTTMDRLKALGLTDAIKVKESVNKEVLATYDDDTLAEVDAKRKTEDKYWCEPREEKYEELRKRRTSKSGA